MLEKIVLSMGCGGDEIQRIQTAHRLRLIETWHIAPGSRVLEIGCGQGDTTAALAWCVGENGFVHGVDIASPEYGAPETLGQARQRLYQSGLGGRLRMDFETDITSDGFQPVGAYDVAVLSHCLWYFSSADELTKVFAAARKYAKRLCVAEWVPVAQIPEQLPHLYAAHIQAICACFAVDTESNIRTMFYPAEIENAMEQAGWAITDTATVSSPDMQDGAWEVAAVTGDYSANIRKNRAIPQKLRQMMLMQIEELRKVSKESIKPLSVVCICSKR